MQAIRDMIGERVCLKDWYAPADPDRTRSGKKSEKNVISWNPARCEVKGCLEQKPKPAGRRG
ncbi:hypothetical protein FRUB_00084 [Fimbriiglobus ruber]|uniref:Uncharacterized protein n=1 Tax=Fimbriiglobus ruber TaxID=1908690 RepID=A0A225ED68_9BACT|nr:hypothetical protein FRUB_00084 [Fimbriiglobus ruber]